jgi:hypothetical protein
MAESTSPAGSPPAAPPTGLKIEVEEAEATPAPEETAPVAPQPTPAPAAPPAAAQPAAQAQFSGSANAETDAKTPEERSEQSRSLFDQMRWVIYGGWTIEGQHAKPEVEPFSSATPMTRGILIGGQLTYEFVGGSVGNFRAGLDVHRRFLSVPRSQGSVDTSYDATFIGALAEGNVNFGDLPVGAGANLSLGLLGLSASNADVGAPYTATFDFGEQGGLGLPFQVYFHGWNNAIRAGFAFDFLPGGFALPTAPGQPDLEMSYGLAPAPFIGIEVSSLISNLSEDSSSEDSAKKAKK